MTSAAHRHDAIDLPTIEGEHTYESLDRRIIGRPLAPFGAAWWIGVAIASSVTLVGVAAAAWLLYRGVGVWGVNVPNAWGFAIVNFVWWIGIGHAGTLISAILLLLRQSWRNSINRFAEAMTLFAVLNAGLFPLLHLGRYWKFYFLLPYPNPMGVWPQWRSPLVWDAFAVATYFTVSVFFWYIGLIPDLAAMRDGSGPRWWRRLAAIGSLGWRGEAGQWARLRKAYLILAGLATALVISVHSIVSLDFAVSIVPGWTPTHFPPYFVAGAIFSGFAMVLTIAIPLRAAFRLRDLITTRHLDVMAKVMLTTGLMVGYGYIMEMLTEWLSGSKAETYRLHARITGHGALPFWTTIVCNVLVSQLLWFKSIRMRPIPLFIVSIIVNIGMWTERYDIVLTSLERGYLPSAWRPYDPTIFDWGLLAGTLGLFALLLLLFIRALPVSPVYEIKELAHEQGRLTPAPRPCRDADTDARVLAAEFDEPEAFRRGAEALRDAGCEDVRAFSPLPVEGITDALQRRPTRIARVFLIGGIAGGATAYLTQWFSAVVDYPWIVDGKPYHSWPSFIPLTYEVTILGASLAGFFGLLIACRLPRLHHPVFDIDGFERASRDRFFLVLRPDDAPRAAAALRKAGALRIVAAPEGAA